MQKAKKSYSDNRARRNITHLNTELQDVQRIMVQNIDEVLQRGAALSGMKLVSYILLNYIILVHNYTFIYGFIFMGIKY